MRFWYSLELGLAAWFLAACQAETPSAPVKEDKAVHFRAVVAGKPVHLALEDCEVFLVAPNGGQREKVLETDFYPMFSACQIQTASADADHITVELGRMAFGASGCCATGGTWRSQDGRTWERRVAGKWVRPGQEVRGPAEKARGREKG